MNITFKTFVFSIRQVVGLLLMLLMSVEALAYDFEVDGLCYNKLSSNQVEVTYRYEYDNNYSGTLFIPEKVKYSGKEFVVSAIGDNAFSRCRGLTGSLVIPNSVTSIGICAFFCCSGLTGSLTIPNSVISIGKQAFYGCSGFTGSLIIPNSVTKIGFKAFEGCNFTGSLTIPNSVTTIEENAFYGCSGFTGSLIIPSSVTSIGDGVFYGCSGFTGSLIIPSSVTSIGSETFYGCRGLTSLVLPSSVTSIGYRTFMYCKNLNYVDSQMETPFSFGGDVFVGIASNAILVIPKGESYPYGIVKYFAEVRWASASYNLSISSSGNGYASYNGTSIRNKTTEFSLTEGTSPMIIFTPDNGYRIKSVKVNGTIVSVTNNQYTISNISSNVSIEVEFEAIPPTTYTLSITSTGSGYAYYDGYNVRNRTSAFTVNEGSNATISFFSDNGYRIKNVRYGNRDVTSSISNSSYTISNISSNVSIEVEFEAIPTTTYTLSITSTGCGYAYYDGNNIRNRTSTFSVNEGSDATISFFSDDGRINSVKVGMLGVYDDVTSSVSNNSYTINNIRYHISVIVEFGEELKTFESDGINYSVSSYDDKTIVVGNGDYGQVLEVPDEVTYQNNKWKVIGIDNDALAGNTKLAAVIWNPATEFTLNVSNPNLLLYVTSANYAPASITNVIVSNTASKIILTDATSGNDFYCPREFTANSISYTHNYGMMTGKGESRGWETIALPFDVEKITHSSKGEITPFANWKNEDDKKPFWLMSYGTGGWTEANSIKAYTPYIISMPNHTDYKPDFRLSGSITFSAENVTVKKTDDLQTGSYNGKTLRPNFTSENNSGCYALNVNNDYVSYNGGANEGSTFVLNLRTVHPFEAYMTTPSNSTRSIAISDDMTTGIEEVMSLLNEHEVVRVYNLQGQQLSVEAGKNFEDVKRLLPAGVYIINGKKQIIK